jgi:hypothetical protein
MLSLLISPSEEDHRYFTNPMKSLGRKLYIRRDVHRGAPVPGQARP